MPNEQTAVLVLKDSTGNHFLMPQEMLERGRVPAKQQAEVETLLAEADVSGYVRNRYEVVTTVVWATELDTPTLGNVLAGVILEAAILEATYGARG